MPRPVAFAFARAWPTSVGGMERHYAALTAAVAEQRPVTCLTSGEGTWERDGVEHLAVAAAQGERRFIAGLAAHLARHGRRYAAVHVAQFPPGAALAALAVLAPQRVPLVADFNEVLPRATWRRLRGRRGGDARWFAQRLALRGAAYACTHLPHGERRLRAEGYRGRVALVPALSNFEVPPRAAVVDAARENLVVSIGRLEAEKRTHLVPAALEHLPGWRAIVFGDGPEREHVAAADGAVELAGLAPWEEVRAALLRARALLFPTSREGFGIVVLEAAAHGVPSVVVDEPDNAAAELVESSPGIVCASADPVELAAAVERVDDAAAARAWFDTLAPSHTPQHAAAVLRDVYAQLGV